jgi:aminopeptidase-like protein
MNPHGTNPDGKSLAALETPEQCRAVADEAWRMMEELYPICRSITGAGVRETLDVIGKRIPLTRTEVPSGTQVFDWDVPKEWNVREAWIEDPAGQRIVDFRNHTLHLMSYSTPVDATLSLAELQPRLHSLPDHPDWIPYRTSYYREDWAFCLPHREREALVEGNYRVRIDSTLAPGNLTYAECVIAGESEQEVLVFTHVCHPALCNDNLTGIALATHLARELTRTKPRLTHRFVFAPGTIGSITWLAKNEANVGRVRHGLVMGLLGDRGPLTYKRSRRGNADIDAIAAYVLDGFGGDARLIDFSPYGYDERQLCSPGFNLPVGRLTRTPNNEYPEYHSSADNFDLIDAHALAGSLRALASILRIADRDERYVNLSPKCEPRLGKRGLYRATGGAHPGEFEHALLWVLNQSDGSASLLDIARRSRLSFAAIAAAADALLGVQLLASAEEFSRRKQ